MPMPVNNPLPDPGPAGFSLLELLVVIALIAALCFSYAGGFGGGQAAALRSAQSAVANLLGAARSRAVANGRPTRLLVNQGAPAAGMSRRYLRCLLLQEQAAGAGGWQAVTEVLLPAGVRVVPRRSETPPGLLESPGQWITIAGGVLESSALSAAVGPDIAAAYPDDTWNAISFDAAGTPDPPGGCVVLAGARGLPAGAALPVQLLNPQDIRGVMISRYGVPVLLNGWNEF